MKCPECGNEITAEMQEMGLCYECGYNFRQVARKEEVKKWKSAHPDADGKYYQYKTIVVPDKKSGKVDAQAIENTLNRMGYEGWRLVSAFSNEVGKNSDAIGVGGVMVGVNSTTDDTVLIFERVARIE